MTNPKVHSYVILHYGLDYLSYAIRSIYNYVDVINIFYTDKPSHGYNTNIQPPETKEQLQQAAFLHNPDKKIKWFDYQGILQEGVQRDTAVAVCKSQGADIVLVVDSDEVWDGLTLDLAIRRVWESDSARNWLINFTHLWRSFNWCCKDEGWPVRLLDLRHIDGTEYIPREYGEIFHFGYAVRDAIMRYKWQIHGHKGELRPDWFETKWDAWPPPEDCHPTNERGFWNPELFDRGRLPKIMQSHPFWGLGMERIE
jgi:hypothetical protein